jgi:hypothetical protein
MRPRRKLTVSESYQIASVKLTIIDGTAGRGYELLCDIYSVYTVVK